MKLKNLCLLSAAAMLAIPATGAFAQVISPSISGAYILSYTEICQAHADGTDNGSVTTESVVANFNPGTGKVTFKGFQSSGVLVVPKLATGAVISTTAVSKTYPFSKTMTQLSINKTLYDVVYGPSNMQIYQSFMFSGPHTAHGGNCAVSGTATIQSPGVVSTAAAPR